MVAATMLPLLMAERYGSLDVLGSSLAAEARARRAKLNAQESADEAAARQAVSNLRACANGTSLDAELAFAHSLGRLGSTAEYAGSYVERVPGNASRFKIHIIYRVGEQDDIGHEADYRFHYDLVTGVVSEVNEIGISYLRALDADCR